MELKLDQWATTPPAGYPGTVSPPPAKRSAGFMNGEEAPAGYFNHAWDALADTQNELANLIVGAGLTRSESDLSQVLKAVKRLSVIPAELSGITQWTDLLVTGAANTTRAVGAGVEAVVAVGGSPTRIRTLRNDAFAWATPSPALSYAGQFNDVHWAVVGGRFVAVGTAGEIQTSWDGLTWVRAATGGPDLNAGASGFDCVVVVGNTGAIKVGSGFGGTESWVTATSAYPSESMNGVAWSPSLAKFCAVGTGHRIQCANEAGTGWVPSTLPASGGQWILGIIWSEKHKQFIAWTAGTIYTSPDGMTWTFGAQVTYPVGFNIASVVALDEHLALFSSLDHNYVLMVPIAEVHAPPGANAVLLTPINASTQDDDYFVDVLHVQSTQPWSGGLHYLFRGRLLGVTKNGKIRATHWFG